MKEKDMKNIFLIIISLVLILNVTACSSVSEDKGEKTSETEGIIDETNNNIHNTSNAKNIEYVIRKINIDKNSFSESDIRKIKKDDPFIDIFNKLIESGINYPLATGMLPDFTEKITEIPEYLIASKEKKLNIWFDDTKTYISINNTNFYEISGDNSIDLQNLIKNNISSKLAEINYNKRNKINKNPIDNIYLEGVDENTKKILQIYKTGELKDPYEESVIKYSKNNENHISKYHFNNDTTLIMYIDENDSNNSIPMYIEYIGIEPIFDIDIKMTYLEVIEKMKYPVYEYKSDDGYTIEYEFYDNYGFDELILSLTFESMNKEEDSIIKKIEIYNWEQYKKGSEKIK